MPTANTGVARLRQLVPALQPWAFWLVSLANAQGWSVHVTSVYRSRKEQGVLYAEWLAGRRSLPVAPPGCSQHQHRLAFDMAVNDDKDRAKVRALGGAWNREGGRWGGVTDPVHFGVGWTPPQGCR